MTTKTKVADPLFSRSEVARVLNVTPLTVANRERLGRYPRAKRDLNDWRIYSLSDVLNLQLLTFNAIDTKTVISVLYDKGYRDIKVIGKLIEFALREKTG